jgi:hypothetical protein
MVTIAESVGLNGANKTVDVIKIQNLINNNARHTELVSPLMVTGKINGELIDAIKTFQANHPDLKFSSPDGRIDPDGKTLAMLKASMKARESYLPSGFSRNHFTSFDSDAFVELYESQYPYPRLGVAAKQGLQNILKQLSADSEVMDIRWAAYMLATVKHECANTWQPIEEYGKGRNYDYGNPVRVFDPSDSAGRRVHLNTYYGRGYVQLTWASNYRKMDAALGLSGTGSLYLYPQNALAPDTAYRIMSYGMRNGTFTGKKLADYIKGDHVDYRNARRIINGTDQAQIIKDYADNIEFLLRFCNSI